MKHIIILFSMISLGVFIYGLLMGPQEGSVFNQVKKVWNQQIESQQTYP